MGLRKRKVLKTYADSSFIVAIYLQQQSSPAIAAFMRRHDQPLPFTPLHRLEVRNAVRAHVFRRQIESTQCKATLKLLEQDLHDQTIVIHAPINWVNTLQQAENLGAAHNETIGCRSADLFHVAAAIEWGADHFLTFDARQKKMAEAAGLAIGV